MTIRIIGGRFRGRKLQTVRGFETRPLLGQVREAVFNILGEQIEDAEVWDLFAGTGANGIEALSRGARRVVFVEKGNRPLAVLRGNLEALDESGEEIDYRIARANAWDPPSFAEGGMAEVAPDVVFFDPPYKAVVEDPTRALHWLSGLAARCAARATLVFHFPEGVFDRDDFTAYAGLDLRTWGTTAVAFVRRDGGATS